MARTARARNNARTSSGPQPRPLPRNPHRTAGDFVKAFFAFVALAVLLIGVPGALAYFVGWPLPHQMPSMDTVQQPITADVFIKVLTVVVWLAWAQFTACVLVEGKAALSGVGMPSRVPGAGPSQLLARQLVAALLLVGATAASLTPGLVADRGTPTTAATTAARWPPPTRPPVSTSRGPMRSSVAATPESTRRAAGSRSARSAPTTPRKRLNSPIRTRSSTESSRPRAGTTTRYGR